jgi:DNA-binding beta-propeller fold protein YncE
MVLSGDGRRAYVAAQEKGRCMVVDLERGRYVTTLDSGRDGVKAGQVVGKALEWLFFFVDDIPPGPLASARPTVALTGDDRHLLILNRRTDDVTVYDTAELKVKDMIATGSGSRALIASSTGQYHYVLASDHLTVFPDADPATASNHLVRQKGRLNVFVDEERGELWVPAKSALEIFGLSTGEPKATVEGISRPSFIVRWPETAARQGSSERSSAGIDR